MVPTSSRFRNYCRIIKEIYVVRLKAQGVRHKEIKKIAIYKCLTPYALGLNL
jgi:hypothetical protein